MSEAPRQQAVSGPAGPAPKRRARSARRTTSIDMTWPEGWDSALRLVGNGRDIVTTDDDATPVVVATGAFEAGIGPARTIEHISVSPDRDNISDLVGCRGGGHLRSALDTVLPGEREAGTPLYLLLDDISGSSLISGFAWSRHSDLWMSRPQPPGPSPDIEGVCIGFSPGNSSLVEVTSGNTTHRTRAVPPLPHPTDPDGWHDLADLPDVSMRRARRIDVWRDDVIVIDSAFQDSARDPEEGRVAVHEYALRATADPESGTLLSVAPEAHVLPFMECPNAVDTAQTLVGTPLADLRFTVLERLAKTNGCTHLNDALRALAEVPVLLAELDRHLDAG